MENCPWSACIILSRELLLFLANCSAVVSAFFIASCIICGFMCGCYNAVDISDYIDLNFDFFKGLLDLRSVPSHDTLSLCLRKTDWCTLSDELSVWLDNNFPEVVKKYGGYEMTSIDGKRNG